MEIEERIKEIVEERLDDFELSEIKFLICLNCITIFDRYGGVNDHVSNYLESALLLNTEYHELAELRNKKYAEFEVISKEFSKRYSSTNEQIEESKDYLDLVLAKNELRDQYVTLRVETHQIVMNARKEFESKFIKEVNLLDFLNNVLMSIVTPYGIKKKECK